MKKRTCLFTALVCALASGPLRADSPYSLQQLTVLHTDAVQRYGADLERATRTGNALDCYFTSIAIMGMLSAVEVSGDQGELLQAMHYIDNMMAATQVNRGHRVWGPASGTVNELYNYQGA